MAHPSIIEPITQPILEQQINSESTQEANFARDKLYYAICGDPLPWLSRKTVGPHAIFDHDFDLWFFETKEEAEEIIKKHSKQCSQLTVKQRHSNIAHIHLHGTLKQKKAAKFRCKVEIEKRQLLKDEEKFACDCYQAKIDKEDLNDPEKVSEKYPYGFKKFQEQYHDIKDRKEKLYDLENVCNQAEQKANQQKIKDDEENYGPYVVKTSGLFYSPSNKTNEEESETLEETRICSPIWPIAYLRNKIGKDHSLLLKVHDGEREHLWAMPKSLIVKPNDINTVLLDLNQEVPIQPKQQKLLQHFLMTATPNKKMRCVDKAGWHGEQYIFPDGEVLGNTKDNDESVYPINEVCPKGIEEKGTHQQWQDNVLILCANNSRLLFSVGVSLSAPCLHLVEDEGGVFNFKGVSSIGKTRCLMVATSVFGSPEFKRSWRTTSNGLEGICSLHNDCLLALDEFGQSDAREVGQIAYMYSQGQGKQRSNRDGSPRDTKTWRGMLLSTGEVGISDHMQDDKNKPKAGQLVRVIDIPAQIEGAFGCFEDLHGFENGVDGEIGDGERFADKLKEVCGESYGTSGRAFIKALIEYGVEKSRTHLKFTRDDFAARVAGKYDGQVKRVANRFGLVYASLSLAIHLKIFSKYITIQMAESAVTRCFNDWLADRGTTDNFESHSIINQVTGLLNENSDSKFIPKNDLDDNRIRTTLWGFKDGSIFYIFPKPFKENLCKGFDEKDAKAMLMKSGLLLPGKRKASQSVRIPAHSKTRKDRFYVIDLNNTTDDEEDITC